MAGHGYDRFDSGWNFADWTLPELLAEMGRDREEQGKGWGTDAVGHYEDFDISTRPESFEEDSGITPLYASMPDLSAAERQRIIDALRPSAESSLEPLANQAGRRSLDGAARVFGVEGGIDHRLPEKYQAPPTTGGEYVGREQPDLRWTVAAEAVLNLQHGTAADALGEESVPGSGQEWVADQTELATSENNDRLAGLNRGGLEGDII